MKHLHKLHILAAIALLILFVFSANVWAENIKDRMLARLPAITSLKSNAAIGEDRNGFLQVITNGQEAAEVVAAENNDRSQVYADIAKQQGVTPNLVGQRRAQQIYNLAKPGQMLQDASGQWYAK